MKIFEVKNCKKSFNGIEVLHDVSCYVNEGEVLSIIGSSGSGKSTLLRCATLLETMDSGTLSYMGEVADLNDKKCIEKIKNYFGLVFQNFNLFPHFTVYKNITDAPLYLKKRDKKEVEAEAMELLDKMGLSDKKDFYPYQLSGGQKQRVALARALALKPKILFFDEPTSALDPELTHEILKVIKELANEKRTMVIVTHEMNFARDVANKIIFIDDGRIVEEGNAFDLITNPKNERTKKFLMRYSE